MIDAALEALVRYRVAGGFILALVYLWLARPTWPSLAGGSLIALAGLAFRAWASGHIRKGERLATDGPYSLVRNPLYLGSFVIGAGLCVMGRHPVLAAAFLLLFGITYRRKMADEERHLATLYGEEYEAYRRAVPRFLPRIARPSPGAGFDWGRLVRHREYQLWLGLLAAVAVLAARMFLRS